MIFSPDLLDSAAKVAVASIASGVTGWLVARWNYEKTIRAEIKMEKEAAAAALSEGLSSVEQRLTKEILELKAEQHAKASAMEARHIEAQEATEQAFALFVKEQGRQWQEHSTHMGRMQGMLETFMQQRPQSLRRTSG